MKREKVYIGEIVVCDKCNTDLTNSDKSGGFICGSYAYCPFCEKDVLESLKKYNEEHLINAFCPKGVSFAEWIQDIRGKEVHSEIISFDSFKELQSWFEDMDDEIKRLKDK